MESTVNIYDVVSLSYNGSETLGVVLDKDIEFDGDTHYPTSTVILRHNQRVILRDSDLVISGKFHTPFTMREYVHVVPADQESQEFYGIVDGISWTPETNEWWFSVMPLPNGEAEMFAEHELTAEVWPKFSVGSSSNRFATTSNRSARTCESIRLV